MVSSGDPWYGLKCFLVILVCLMRDPVKCLEPRNEIDNSQRSYTLICSEKCAIR